MYEGCGEQYSKISHTGRVQPTVSVTPSVVIVLGEVISVGRAIVSVPTTTPPLGPPITNVVPWSTTVEAEVPISYVVPSIMMLLGAAVGKGGADVIPVPTVMVWPFVVKVVPNVRVSVSVRVLVGIDSELTESELLDVGPVMEGPVVEEPVVDEPLVEGLVVGPGPNVRVSPSVVIVVGPVIEGKDIVWPSTTTPPVGPP
jgi:hypothetical protein